MRQFVISLFFSLCCLVSNAQEYTVNYKSVTGIFPVPEKTKSEIFAQITRWISINYNSAKSVIQLSDPETGTIVVKGSNTVYYKNPSKLMYPNMRVIKDIVSLECRHTIEFNVKDGRYRMIIQFTDMQQEQPTPSNFYECIYLDTIDSRIVARYNSDMDEYFKKSMINKDKRQKYTSATEPILRDIKKDLLTFVYATMKSVNKSVKATPEDW